MKDHEKNTRLMFVNMKTISAFVVFCCLAFLTLQNRFSVIHFSITKKSLYDMSISKMRSSKSKNPVEYV